jgi:hypothetical protein
MNKESNTTETAIDANTVLTGVFVYLTSNPAEAWAMIKKLSECRNCSNFSRNLFEFRCSNPEGEKSFELSSENSSCECFYARSKKVKYWINKLASIAMEYDGINDFMRQLEYHQKNGTDSEFLGFK